jgi:CheY-like chemotaxis protein
MQLEPMTPRRVGVPRRPRLAKGDKPHVAAPRSERRDDDPDIDGRIRTILVVDDDSDLVEALRIWLEEEGFATQGARNGKAALDLLRTQPLPDLVLLDLLMPIMDGCDLYDVIRCDQAFQSIAVIAMTALGDLPKTRYMPQVLRKPLDYRRLLSAIRLAR